MQSLRARRCAGSGSSPAVPTLPIASASCATRTVAPSGPQVSLLRHRTCAPRAFSPG